VTDYSSIDQSLAIRYIFYPRRDFTECPENAFDLPVPVEDNVLVLCRFYGGDVNWPWILFFHGNGEVVSDYDEVAPLYNKKGLNIVVADYRGYGVSGGFPTLTALVRDAHVLFKAVTDELAKRGFRPHLWVMGRSLGSISALELASKHQEAIRGLIIESGFTSVVRIIKHLGLPVEDIALEEIDQDCVNMLKGIRLPTLIIHGEWDTLVPEKEAEELYRNLGSKNKELLVIPSADHNDVLLVGFDTYFRALQTFMEVTGRD
jgi:pimeloyl-ACP methyl ester carboxylesterase